MQLHFYGMCGLVSIFGLHSTTAASKFADQPVQIQSQYQFKKEVNTRKPMAPIVDCQIPEQNNNDMKKLKLQDIVAITTSDLASAISVKPKPVRCTKLREKRRDVVLKALKQILEHKTRNTHQTGKNDKDKVQDINSIAASNVVKVALAKTRSKRFAKLEKKNTSMNEVDVALNLAQALAKIRTKSSAKLEELNNKTNEMNNAKTRSKRYANHEKVNTKIDELNNGRDIVLEVVKQLIDSEKTRRRFDMVNPPHTKYSKRQQLLWDRLRVKAAAELLLHSKPLPQRPTERVYNSLKMDMELATPEPTLEPGLFNDFKRKIQEAFYLDEYERERGREFISTLKPRVYE